MLLLVPYRKQNSYYPHFLGQSYERHGSYRLHLHQSACKLKEIKSNQIYLQTQNMKEKTDEKPEVVQMRTQLQTKSASKTQRQRDCSNMSLDKNEINRTMSCQMGILGLLRILEFLWSITDGRVLGEDWSGAVSCRVTAPRHTCHLYYVNSRVVLASLGSAVKPNRGFHYFSRTARRLSYNDRSVVTFLTFLSEIRRPAASPVLRRINFVSSIHLRLRTLEKETTTREKTGDSCSADHKQQSYRKLHGWRFICWLLKWHTHYIRTSGYTKWLTAAGTIREPQNP